MTERQRTTITALLALVATAAPVRGAPDLPAINRDVALVRSTEFTYPHIPPLRTTADGRVGINPNQLGNALQFYLMVPEALAEPFVAGAPGDGILAGATAYEVPASQFHGSNDPRHRHYGLCETTDEFPSPGELTSPYACGASGRDDCYDFVVLTSTSSSLVARERQLWGTTVTVRVAHPKTVDAAIAQVITAPPRAGGVVYGQFLFEPTATQDGRLLSARVATSDFAWTPSGSDQERRHFADLVYSFNATGSPCDVRAWKTFYPISHAPYDPAINSRYGFAMYPFRDAVGTVLPDGADLGISYPWIDRKGRNLFYTSLGSLLTLDGILQAGSDGPSRYPLRCVPGVACTSRFEFFDRTRGQGVAGLWTRGKMVLLDGILNNTEYGLELAEAGHRLVELYRDGSGPRGDESGEVRVGSGRGPSSDDPVPAAFIGNANILDSTENLFNVLPNLQPVTPRDVTWILNNGKASDEIVFDEWLDLDAFIVSEMVGATEYRDVVPGAGALFYHDGWGAASFSEPVKIQNAATPLPERWRVPPTGVGYGDVRLEPVALGGIRGKGLWLDGHSGVEYAIPAQNVAMENVPWYLGIFVDSRFPDDETERTLIGFPDGARIALRGRREVLYAGADGTVWHRVDLVEPLPYGSWSHLGFQLLPDDSAVRFDLDGFAFDLVSGKPDTPRLSPGSLFVGDDPRDGHGGLRGWIDRFVVIARELSPELACNHAAGTLAALDDDSDAASTREWIDTAARYPGWAHRRIGDRVATESAATRYVCFHGYGADFQSHAANLPDELRPLRHALLFPEGPIRYGHPRPDSTANPFCLSCHSSDGPGGLNTAALVETPDRKMEDDRRRQPSQPLRRVFGNIPRDWLGPAKPPRHIEAPPAGLKTDALLAGEIAPVEAATTRTPACAGDCDADRRVSVAELTTTVRIALGTAPFAQCRRAFDCGESNHCLGIADITRAVNNALAGCPR